MRLRYDAGADAGRALHGRGAPRPVARPRRFPSSPTHRHSPMCDTIPIPLRRNPAGFLRRASAAAAALLRRRPAANPPLADAARFPHGRNLHRPRAVMGQCVPDASQCLQRRVQQPLQERMTPRGGPFARPAGSATAASRARVQVVLVGHGAPAREAPSAPRPAPPVAELPLGPSPREFGASAGPRLARAPQRRCAWPVPRLAPARRGRIKRGRPEVV